ncbi:MAG: hypothetical protein AB2693_23365 [Candidatus Thiodiazotropha sp.]
MICGAKPLPPPFNTALLVSVSKSTIMVLVFATFPILVSWRVAAAGLLTRCGPLMVYRIGRAVAKPNEPVLYNSQDRPQRDVEGCTTSLSVTFQTRQTDVVAGVAPGVVQQVDAELLGFLWLISPEQRDVTCSTVVKMGLLELQDMVDLTVEPHETHSLILAFVDNQFIRDCLA